MLTPSPRRWEQWMILHIARLKKSNLLRRLFLSVKKIDFLEWMQNGLIRKNQLCIGYKTIFNLTKYTRAIMLLLRKVCMLFKFKQPSWLCVHQIKIHVISKWHIDFGIIQYFVRACILRFFAKLLKLYTYIFVKFHCMPCISEEFD